MCNALLNRVICAVTFAVAVESAAQAQVTTTCNTLNPSFIVQHISERISNTRAAGYRLDDGFEPSHAERAGCVRARSQNG